MTPSNDPTTDLSAAQAAAAKWKTDAAAIAAAEAQQATDGEAAYGIVTQGIADLQADLTELQNLQASLAQYAPAPAAQPGS